MAPAGDAARLPRLRRRRRPPWSGLDLDPRVGGTMSVELTLAAIALTALSGVPGVFLPRASPVGERIAALLMAAGSLCGLLGALDVAVFARIETFSMPWDVPGGSFAIRIDAL